MPAPVARERCEVGFGEDVAAATTVAAAEWIAPARRGRAGTVGALVPTQYRSVLRIRAPAPTRADWWALYREVFVLVAAIGARHTSASERAWFAIWEGHGFANSATRVSWSSPALDEAERRARDGQRARLREQDELRNAAIRAELESVPQFDVPDRSYYLLVGPLAAVTTLRYPGFDGWRNPDLFWPDDRRWFAATDVDFWSLYVAGDDRFTRELACAFPRSTEQVRFDTPLEAED